mmetsp:Transcript_13812/g.16017  ORF Transcript_13812/g.16017 Transcript_13812/m.16017 type:complete len:96 (+) Transcript_13812:360-647(+)
MDTPTKIAKYTKEAFWKLADKVYESLPSFTTKKPLPPTKEELVLRKFKKYLDVISHEFDVMVENIKDGCELKRLDSLNQIEFSELVKLANEANFA